VRLSRQSEPVRFRGAVVESFIERGWPGGSLVVDRERLEFRRGYPGAGYRQAQAVGRGEVAALVVRQRRVVPFLWGTFITVRLNDGTYFPRMFSPLRARAVVAELRRDGWPVERGDRLGWDSVATDGRP